jgi:NADH-quinone oxidoreductase subunit C
MSESATALAALLQKRFGAALGPCSTHAGQVTAELEPGNLLEVCLALRDDADFRFDQLVDLCGMDYESYGQADWQTSESATSSGFSRGVDENVYDDNTGIEARFAVVYHLLSTEKNERLRLRAKADGEPPRVDSVLDIWSAANWYEREAFDLYGILFVGHPDLRRILTDYGFIGHPFRKDFPLIGEVEMRYDPQMKRVVYEPVSIEPRTLVPKVIRRDERYAEEDGDDA